MKRFFVYAGLAIILFLFLVAQEDGCNSDNGSEEDTGQTPAAAVTEADEDEADEPAEAPLAAELEYLDELGTLTIDMSLLLDNIVDLSTEAADDPTVLFGEEWFRDLGREQDRLNEAQSTFLALQPPPKYVETHRLMTQALNELDIALDLFETGGRDFDAVKISEAVDHMVESTRLVEESTAALPE